jgi:CII-binding regulator of phage lambda lysogenization HflD
MGKEIAKQAGLSAAEGMLQALLPQLLQRLDSIEAKMDRRFSDLEKRINQMDQRLHELDQKVESLRVELKDELNNKTDILRDVINELGQRISRFEGKVEVLASSIQHSDRRMETWIERTVRIEMNQSPRRRRAS